MQLWWYSLFLLDIDWVHCKRKHLSQIQSSGTVQHNRICTTLSLSFTISPHPQPNQHSIFSIYLLHLYPDFLQQNSKCCILGFKADPFRPRLVPLQQGDYSALGASDTVNKDCEHLLGLNHEKSCNSCSVITQSKEIVSLKHANQYQPFKTYSSSSWIFLLLELTLWQMFWSLQYDKCSFSPKEPPPRTTP